MKLVFPLTNPDLYHNDPLYLKMWVASNKVYFNDRLVCDGVVFVKDVLEAFHFSINGCDLGILAQAWISPTRAGTNGIHDKRYGVKFYVQENKRLKSFPWKYNLVLIINDKPRGVRAKTMEEALCGKKGGKKHG